MNEQSLREIVNICTDKPSNDNKENVFSWFSAYVIKCNECLRDLIFAYSDLILTMNQFQE